MTQDREERGLRGIIFRAFLNFIEARFGYERVDALLSGNDFPNKGGFSGAGNYDPAYLLKMVTGCKGFCHGSEEEVLEAFGEFAFGFLSRRFKKTYEGTQSVLNAPTAYDFLENLNVIHLDELNKLYPDARFPRFDIERPDPRHIIIEYASPLNLPSLVLGLIRGCLKEYGDPSGVTMERTSRKKEVDGVSCPVYRFEVRDGV